MNNKGEISVIPFSLIFGIIGGFIALLVIVQFLPDVAAGIENVSEAIGGVGGLVLGLLFGIIIAFGLVKYIADIFGLKLGI